MAGKWSSGKRSYGICDRSGFKVRYQDLKTEWNGLRVDKAIWEPKHEALTPVRITADPQTLRNPRPDDRADATAYPTWATDTATTQLHEVLTMTFGGTT
jgi:hypothetical protein